MAEQVNLYGFERIAGDLVEIEDISRDGSEITICRWLDEGADESEDLVISVPTAWQICDECHGEGMSLCDSLRGVAITESDRGPGGDWGPDEMREYFSGGYDTQCGSCRGAGKVRVPMALSADVGAPSWLVELVDEWYRDQAAFTYESACERRMGA
jgi:hypothetical protein